MENLSVIVPVYNEEKFLKKSLKRLLEIDEGLNILIVDDCSEDNSVNIAKSFSESNPRIKLITKNRNQGKGSVLVEGFKNVDTEYCAIHDADLEYFPKDLTSMYQEINEKTIVLGSRFIGNLERKNIYIRTFIANKFMSKFFSLINRVRVSDVATCYKMFPTNMVKNLDLQEQGFSIEVELLSKLLEKSSNYIEIPIHYEGRSYKEGKKIKLKDGIYYLINTIKYRVKK